MPPGSHAEIERKYDVAAGAPLPDLTRADGVASLGACVVEDLDAVYFDTDDLALTRHGLTLRRRTGGEDAGWHLKLPAGRDERTEIHRPLGRAVKTVPAPIRTMVRALTADRPLVPIARVTTRRTRRTVLDAEGEALADLCDDEVTTERLVGEPQEQAWREWEIELVHGDRLLLERLDAVVRDAGATPGVVSSKLARALGDLRPLRRPAAAGDTGDTAGALVTAHLRRHLDGLLEQDVRMRADASGAVHRMRIQARRLRSTLTTYRPLFVDGSVDDLREELRWLGQALSAARDAQVQRERLAALTASEPEELVHGPITEQIDTRLLEAQRAGLAEGLAALDSQRYLDLLEALQHLVEAPPFVPRAEKRATKVVPQLLRRDARRLEGAVDAARAATGPERDPAFHEARKKAKRLRYALESSVPLYGDQARRLVAEITQLQDALGQRQDSVVARGLLHDYAAQVHLGGDSTFTFGRLHATEERRGHEHETEFVRLWRRRPTRKLRRRLEK